MVEQVLADAREVVADVDAQGGKVLAGADAGVQQQPGRVHRARADDDFAGGAQQDLLAVLRADVDAGGAGAVELQAVRPRLQQDAEVGAVTGLDVRVEVGHRRGGALVVLGVVGEVEEADALVERLAVEAVHARNPGRLLGGVDEVAGDGVAVLLVDRDDVVAQLGEVRVHRGRVPALGARLGPLVPVAGQRLEADQRVVRGAAAQHPGAAVPDVAVAARLFGGGVVVVEVAAQEPEPAAQGQDVVAVDVGGAALDDRDGHVRVLGEPRGDDRSGGAAADDHVVGHGAVGDCGAAGGGRHRSLLLLQGSCVYVVLRTAGRGPGIGSSGAPAGVSRRTSAGGAG